jgi:hypothetical protein
MAAALENPSPVYRKIDDAERDRAALLRRIVELEKEDESAIALANVTEPQVRRMLSRLADDMRLYGPRRAERLPRVDSRPRRARPRRRHPAAVLPHSAAEWG